MQIKRWIKRYLACMRIEARKSQFDFMMSYVRFGVNIFTIPQDEESRNECMSIQKAIIGDLSTMPDIYKAFRDMNNTSKIYQTQLKSIAK